MKTLIKILSVLILIICTTNLFPQENKTQENPFSYKIYSSDGEKYKLIKSPQFLEVDSKELGWEQVDLERAESFDTIHFIDTTGLFFGCMSHSMFRELIGEGGIFDLFTFQKEREIKLSPNSKVTWNWLPVKEHYQYVVLLKPKGNKIYLELVDTISLGSNSKILSWLIWLVIVFGISGLIIYIHFLEAKREKIYFSWGQIWPLLALGFLVACWGGLAQITSNDPIGAKINLFIGGFMAIIPFILPIIYFFVFRKKKSSAEIEKELWEQARNKKQ